VQHPCNHFASGVSAVFAVVIALALFIAAVLAKGDVVTQITLLAVSGFVAIFATFVFLWIPAAADVGLTCRSAWEFFSTAVSEGPGSRPIVFVSTRNAQKWC
jgi:hypothetical protein